MKIKEISIRNFRSYYGENKFEFSDGLTLIIGDNGDGKQHSLRLYSGSLIQLQRITVYTMLLKCASRNWRSAKVMRWQ